MVDLVIRANLATGVFTTDVLNEYDGEQIHVYAGNTATGTQSGSSEANRTTCADALANVVAGENIGLVPGTGASAIIGASTAERWLPTFSPTNSGTAQNPIKIIGKYNPLLIYDSQPQLMTEFRQSNGFINLNNSLDNGWQGNSAVLGPRGSNNYIHFKNIFADQNFAPPRPANGTLLVQGTGIKWENVYIRQIAFIESSVQDNYNGFYVESALDPIIRRVLFSGGYSATLPNHNSCGIVTYAVRDYLFEYLTFQNANCGIFIKGDPSGQGIHNYGTIRYVHAVDGSNSLMDISDPHPSFQNIVEQCFAQRQRFGFVMDNATGGPFENIIFRRSTAVDCFHGGIIIENNGAGKTNNVIEDMVSVYTTTTNNEEQRVLDWTQNATVGTGNFRNNRYMDPGRTARFRLNGVNDMTLAQMQAAGTENASTEDSFTVGSNGITQGVDNGSTVGQRRGLTTPAGAFA